MAAALASAHQSNRSTTSASSRGRATTSGGCSNRPSKARTTSRYDLPYVCPARDSTSDEQISVSVDGGVSRGGGRSNDDSVGAGRAATSATPSRAATAAPRAETWSADSASSSQPQPHHDRRRSPMRANPTYWLLADVEE